MKYPDKKIIVFDYGLYVSLALRLSQDFGEVFYYNATKVDYMTSDRQEIGEGFDEIKRIYSFWKCVKENKIDLFVFPCVGDGDLQEHLIEMGYNVWGSREGDTMEIDRWGFLQYQKSIGMDVPESELVIGITNLRKKLYGQDKEKIVKMDADERGDSETFRHVNEEMTEINEIRPLEATLGMKSELKKFIVQDVIETKAEIGYDGFCIDGKFPETALFGIEVKDMGYIGEVRPYSEIPEGCKIVNKQLTPALKGYGYRGNISTEIREGEDGKHYLIDMTCRFPYPPTNVMLEIWDNISECLYEGAQGNLVDMKFRAKYGIEVEMFSDSAKDQYFALFYPDELKQWIKQPYCTRIDGRTWVIPQESKNSNVGSLVAIGDTIEECVALVKERASKIQGHHLKIDFTCVDSAIEELKKL